MTKKTKTYLWEIGLVSGELEAINQKKALIKAVKKYLDVMPYADGSHLPRVLTKLKEEE